MNQSQKLPENEESQSFSPLSEIEGLKALIQTQSIRIDSLEKFAANNRQRIKNSKALNALLVVLCIPLIVTADFQFGDKWVGNLKSRELDTADILAFVAIGSAAIGVISVDELMAFFTKK